MIPARRLLRQGLLVGAAALALWPAGVRAHDASGWGGLFRSRDAGATWFQANQGRLVGGALGVAVEPGNPDHVLLGTDDGVLVTRNGGRDWESPAGAPRGPVFSVAVDSGGRLLAASGLGVFRSETDNGAWQTLATPSGLMPVRALVSGHAPGQVFAIGAGGVRRSDDFGQSWRSPGQDFPDGTATGLLITPANGALCIVDGRLWALEDAAATWLVQSDGLPPGPVQAVSVDPSGTIWAAAADRLYATTPAAGGTWQSVGNPLPEAGTEIRGVAASRGGARLIVSSHRGVYASADRGMTWSVLGDNLPGHLEAGPLVVDPGDPATLYVGFSLTPYDEQWRRFLTGGDGAARLASVDLVGGIAFLALLGLLAGVALRWLARRDPTRLVEPAA